MAGTPAPKAVPLDVDALVNNATGTQLKEAFHSVGIDLDSFCPPGACNPGVYNGVQLVDAFKAYDKKTPGKIDMNLVSTDMRGSQIRDLFKVMTAPAAAATNP